MAAKKETPHTFEYFKTSEVFINGRFKEYVDKMWVQNKVQESMVKRLVDLYAIAAVIGLRIKRRLPDDRQAAYNPDDATDRYISNISADYEAGVDA